ncbi:MAG: double-strand break repair helicase AddA [Rhodobacter sp.]|nr:double-strand break repair helicase AddA [Rhodobacter sp.]
MTVTAAGLAQTAAANPRHNTWLFANAGSGKTRVLTDRVARLLLNGVEPQHILCLTYTKAAASEMQNRLFKRLGAWAMKPDTDLRQDLLELGEDEMAAPRLARARQLFARAIESPGGLRIQTIHSFCASLLRRFPLEAGVPPGFTEMDDRAAKLMRAEIVEEMADTLAPDAVRRLTEVHGGEDFTKFVEQIARHRGSFSPPLGEAEVWRLFGLAPDVGMTGVLANVFLGAEAHWMPEVVGILGRGLVTDVKAAQKLRGINFAAPGQADLEALEGVLLFGITKDPDKSHTAKIGDFPTKETRANLGALIDPLNDLMARVETARRQRVALATAEKTLALHQFAGVFLPEYATRKAARGLLDFDDLIARARALLTDRALAAWVLFRLDGGIDHILVDEAQDTSPDQWELIESLAAELTAGEGASNRPRTLFVVGDKKQSIYSFQGADVAAFDRKRDFFRNRLAGGPGLAERLLAHSFRSSTAILTVVDQTFTGGASEAVGADTSHIAFNADLAGRVDVWPVVESAAKLEQGPWYEPLDLPSPEDAEVRLARAIAERIRETVTGGEQIPQVPRNGGPVARPVRYGDFLILVQRRSPLFHEIIRACKALELPIAGADRLKLGGEMAVKDLSALLAFLDTPEDDLSLAAVLRSPLCGWSERDLFQLAQGRRGYLWEALRDHSGHAETQAFLDDLRGQADFLRPYDLIERVLHRHAGRRKLLARLGPEAEDGIDELLSQALAYEGSEVPSLTGFMVWMQTDDVEVKRQLDGEGERIRVMTVHGAKGLEAEIVILPDTGDRPQQDRDELYRLPGGEAVWKVRKEESPALISAERAARQAREAAERLRLLYVAMTRARCWLIAVAKGEVKQADAWYNLIRAGVESAGAERLEGGVLRHSWGDWPLPVQTTSREVRAVALPDWSSRPAPEVLREPKVLSPSDLGGAKALPGEPLFAEEEAKARGVALHLLLERLPPVDRAEWAAEAATLIPDAALAAGLLAEARAVLDDPALALLFGPETLAEVAVTGPWQGRQLMGTIDRLLIGPDRVLIVDYKSNAVIPPGPAQVPEGILRQLGAYVHLVAQIYPERRVETAVLWTKGPVLMPVDPEIVRLALARATIP